MPDTGTQNTWVLKIDSDGCEVANCIINSSGEIITDVKGLNVYSNPSQNIFHFALNKAADEIKKIEISNIMGEKILFTSNKNIDMNGYAAGIYFYKVITTKGKTFNGKIIKE